MEFLITAETCGEGSITETIVADTRKLAKRILAEDLKSKGWEEVAIRPNVSQFRIVEKPDNSLSRLYAKIYS